MRKSNPSAPVWRTLTRTHPSAFLLAAQLLSLVLYAAFNGNSNGRALLGALGVVVLTLVVWVVDRSPAINWVAWILVAPAILLSLLSIWFADPVWLTWAALLEATLYFYAAFSMMAYMMKDYRVTSDELFAAGSTFTLLAWGFAYLFVICQALAPGSFAGMINPDQPRTFLDLLFLSFANLTAAGLSDILPVTPPARVLVMLEQFAGVGYLALVVSRLIGMTIIRRKDQQTS